MKTPVMFVMFVIRYCAYVRVRALSSTTWNLSAIAEHELHELYELAVAIPPPGIPRRNPP